MDKNLSKKSVTQKLPIRLILNKLVQTKFKSPNKTSLKLFDTYKKYSLKGIKSKKLIKRQINSKFR